MELRHLRYFVAVAEEENITRAAERLYVSQPPLSRQIRDLEEEIGVQLLERRARSVHLTEAGRIFLEEARAVLLRADQAVTAVKAMDMRIEFHLGFAPSPTAGFLSSLLNAFQRIEPKARVTLHDMSSAEMLAGLRRGKIHAALMVEPGRRLTGGLRFEALRSYPIGLVAAPAHPFARKKKVSISEAAGEPLAVFNSAEYPDYDYVLRRTFDSRVKGLKIAEECDGALSLIAAVESACAIAVLPEFIMNLAGSRLRFLPLNPAPPSLTVGVCYSSRGARPLLKHFLKVARAAVRE